MRHRLVSTAIFAALLVWGGRARAVELSYELTQLYASVSIFPPTAERMTICYGFVCRRRMILDFTPADRKTLTDVLAKGRASLCTVLGAICFTIGTRVKSASILAQPLVSLTPFLPATVLRGPLRVRALVRVRWPRTGKLRR